MTTSRIAIPSLVRIKPGALERLGIYLTRPGWRAPAVFKSAGMVPAIAGTVAGALAEARIEPVVDEEVEDASIEAAMEAFTALPPRCDAVVGLGGGRALDVAKYVAFLARKPYVAVPTSLSNDGFSSPGASLTVRGRRRSLPSALPYGVVVDTTVCGQAPLPLWHSGVGDLVAKITAVHDWKLAFHAVGTPVNDLAALLSDATVHQFTANPVRTDEGVRLLGTALLLNGIAMEMCGSSRPASGSEHLVSHALDELSPGTHLHGIQVGVATYLLSHLQGQGTERIASVLDRTGFWDTVRATPFDREVFLAAVRRAPSIKPDFHTVLDEVDAPTEVARLLDRDERLAGCIV
ncbi:MAG: iron-containing alcohol dehydrogenase family protein [Nitriliruptoraceae bacterium]